jgi:2-polyprenyl-3-methyl-5-hydroxy-6-metoxy-1,4-benzoquinol methylase
MSAQPENNTSREDTSDSVKNDLEFVNRHFAFGFEGLSENSKSDSLSVVAKTLGNFLQPYFAASVRYRSSIVRLLNFLFESKARADQQLIDDIETRIHEQNDRIDTRLSQSYAVLEERLQTLEQRSSGVEATLAEIDSVTRGLEALVRGAANTPDETSQRLAEVRNTDNSYILLENRYRGSEETITERMKPHAARIRELLSHTSQAGPVLEIGCGRGELLSLLLSESIEAIGIEPDQAMVRRCKDKGLNVQETDAVEYLQALDDHSVRGIVAIQVIEHLSNEYRSTFLDLVKRKTVRGGFLVLETINTSSFLPLLQNYFRDPTHVFPLHPDTLRTVLEQSGLVVSEVVYSSEYPEEAKLPMLPPAEGMPPRHQELSRQINERLAILNRLVFGSQDYAIIAKVP